MGLKLLISNKAMIQHNAVTILSIKTILMSGIQQINNQASANRETQHTR